MVVPYVAICVLCSPNESPWDVCLFSCLLCARGEHKAIVGTRGFPETSTETPLLCGMSLFVSLSHIWS